LKFNLMKRLIRKLLWSCGWDLKRFNPANSEWARLQRLLDVHTITAVLDVGANVGQYAKNLRDAGYRGKIVSFEPLSSAYSGLTKASQSDPGWKIAPRMALGDRDGSIDIHVSRNSVSSSALELLNAHCDADPSAAYRALETVRMARLDSVVDEFLRLEDVVFLKLDVQGFESQVLTGAARNIKRIAGVQIELSLVPLYDSQTLFRPMIDELSSLGFELWALIPGFTNQRTGRLLQIDGVFFRSEACLHKTSHLDARPALKSDSEGQHLS
jgi:FkbM family methyltransferase